MEMQELVFKLPCSGGRFVRLGFEKGIWAFLMLTLYKTSSVAPRDQTSRAPLRVHLGSAAYANFCSSRFKQKTDNSACSIQH